MAGRPEESGRVNMIPSAKPFLGKEEVRAAREAILSGWVTQGPKVKRFEEAFARTVGAKYACAVSSCTSALHLALRVLDVKPGNVVITVSHSFISAANSIRYCGGEPVFVDVELDTYNISPMKLAEVLEKDCEFRSGRVGQAAVGRSVTTVRSVGSGQLFYKKISQLVTPQSPLHYLSNGKSEAACEKGKVAAILVVHQMGMPCDLRGILPLAKKFRLPVVEDAACALGSQITMDHGRTWDRIGKPHADIACFSFHPLKVLTTGEGGMLTTSNPNYDQKLRLLRHQGMSVSDLERHRSKEVIIEGYPEMGYNYRMTDIQAAIGLEQLKKLGKIVKRRRELASFYQKGLSRITWLKVPTEPEYCKTNWQSFPVRLLDKAPSSRNALMQHLRSHGVLTRLGIMNAHQEKPYLKKNDSLKNSEVARNTVLILPLFYAMKDREIKKVVKLIKNV